MSQDFLHTCVYIWARAAIQRSWEEEGMCNSNHMILLWEHLEEKRASTQLGLLEWGVAGGGGDATLDFFYYIISNVSSRIDHTWPQLPTVHSCACKQEISDTAYGVQWMGSRSETIPGFYL